MQSMARPRKTRKWNPRQRSVARRRDNTDTLRNCHWRRHWRHTSPPASKLFRVFSALDLPQTPPEGPGGLAGFVPPVAELLLDLVRVFGAEAGDEALLDELPALAHARNGL